MKPDVIVVGAGPAGSATALTAARSGARVLLIDRQAFPRDKACGDGLTPRAMSALAALGIAVPDGPRVEAQLYRTPWQHSAEPRRRFETGVGSVVSRRILDERLAFNARQAGAELWTETQAERLIVQDGEVRGVVLRVPGGRHEAITAPVTVIAEGSVGALARSAPLPSVAGRLVAFAVRRYLEGVEWTDAPYFDLVLPLESKRIPLVGYGWVFPAGDDLANVGVGAIVERIPPTRLRDQLYDFEAWLAREDPRFRRARAVGRPSGAPIRIGGHRKACHAPGLLVVGDSAGLPNFLSAEGISRALESGMLAGHCAVDFLAGRASLACYGDKVVERFPEYERVSSSLPALYRQQRHVALEFVPMLNEPGRLSSAMVALTDAECFASASRPHATTSHSVEDIAENACASALRMLSRDRPFFGEILVRLNRLVADSAFAARALISARAEFPGFDPASRSLRRSAVTIELLRMAALLLCEVPAVKEPKSPTPPDRGGTWLTATLAILLADRVLARSFSVVSSLDEPARGIAADALADAMGILSRHALDRSGKPDDNFVTAALAGTAARAGARLGGASSQQAERMAAAARERAPRVGSAPTGELISVSEGCGAGVRPHRVAERDRASRSVSNEDEVGS